VCCVYGLAPGVGEVCLGEAGALVLCCGNCPVEESIPLLGKEVQDVAGMVLAQLSAAAARLGGGGGNVVRGSGDN
jgi:hypothetical protein